MHVVCPVTNCPHRSASPPLHQIPAEGPVAVLYLNGKPLAAYASKESAYSALLSLGGLGSGDQVAIGYATGTDLVPTPCSFDEATPAAREDAVGSRPPTLGGVAAAGYFYPQAQGPAVQGAPAPPPNQLVIQVTSAPATPGTEGTTQGTVEILGIDGTLQSAQGVTIDSFGGGRMDIILAGGIPAADAERLKQSIVLAVAAFFAAHPVSPFR